MPIPDQKPLHHNPVQDALRAIQAASNTTGLTNDWRRDEEHDSHVLRELRHLRAEVAELRRTLLPSASGLILGAQAAAEFRRITRSPT